MSELLSIATGLAGLALHLAFALGLHAWARRVAKARGGVFRALAYLPLVAFGAATIGGSITSWMLVDAFEAVADAPVEQRAATLSIHIAEAMMATAVGLGVAIVLYVASVISSAIGGRGSRAR